MLVNNVCKKKKCFTALSRQAKSSGEPDQIVQLQIRTKVQPNVEQKTDEDDIYAPEGVTNQEHYRFLGFYAPEDVTNQGLK